MPYWTIVEAEIQKEVIDLRGNKVHKNALPAMRYGLVYLDYIDVCKGSYGTRAQKCVKYFAILFQGSNATDYTWKTIPFVACFKYIWKNLISDTYFLESSTFNKTYI